MQSPPPFFQDEPGLLGESPGALIADRLETRFGGVLEAIPDAIVLVDEGGRIALVNRETERLFGYGRAELLGQPVALLVPEPLPRAADNGRKLPASRKDGTAFLVEVRLGSVTSGPDTLTIASIRDVAEERGTAALRAMLDTGPDALVVVDGTGRIVLVNALLEQLFGYAPAELFDRPLEDLLPARFRRRHRGHLTRYFADPHARPMGSGLELRGQRKDGSEFSIEISLSPVRAADGTLVTAAIRDVSERVRKEERRREASDRELHRESAARSMTQEINERLIASSLHDRDLAEIARQANEAKSRFLAAMAHEFRTPLNAITGYAGLIEVGIAGPVTARQQEYLGKIQVGVRHLVRLIDDTLDLAKIEAGQLRLVRTPGSVRDAIEEALDLVGPLAAADQVELVTAPRPPHPVRYLGDPDRIRQVLVNLLSNAVKFTEQGGRVYVRCGETSAPPADTPLPGSGPWTFVSVEDTGIGIAPEDAAKVFQPFVRVQAASARTRPGTGLGLAISRELARRMQGDLTLRSVVGEGSCFTLWLPADVSESA